MLKCLYHLFEILFCLEGFPEIFEFLFCFLQLLVLFRVGFNDSGLGGVGRGRSACGCSNSSDPATGLREVQSTTGNPWEYKFWQLTILVCNIQRGIVSLPAATTDTATRVVVVVAVVVGCFDPLIQAVVGLLQLLEHRADGSQFLSTAATAYAVAAEAMAVITVRLFDLS